MCNTATITPQATTYTESFTPEFVEAYKQRIQNNRKRGNRVSLNARANSKVRRDLINWWALNPNSVTIEVAPYITTFRKSIAECGRNSLYRQFDNNAIEYIGTHTCKHKLCAICNAERSKQVRKKYINFFEGSKFTINSKHVVNKQVINEYGKLVEVSEERLVPTEYKTSDFNFMHLTLTVPHNSNGYKGNKVYIRQLMKTFNLMRKKKWWKKHVFAGEFGVEFTKNENGYHIHIHSLLLVNKSYQSRNKLHREILLWWNRNTINPDYNRKQLKPELLEKLQKSNALLSENDLKQLHPQGATIIGLENIYKFKNGKKVYVDANNQDDWILGILETIKYHFEPFVLKKETGEYDFNMLVELIPHISGQPLYRKFGAFHGVKELNLSEKPTKEEMAQEVEELLEDLDDTAVLNPVTLQPAEPLINYRYVVCHASNIFYAQNNAFIPSLGIYAKPRALPAENLRQALFELMDSAITAAMVNKQKAQRYKYN